MSITIGRKHGNGYHDSVCCKVSITNSQSFKDLLEYESDQLKEHSGIIFERDYVQSWIERTCSRCPDKYPQRYMEKRGDIFECPICGLKKIPKGVEYKGGKQDNG